MKSHVQSEEGLSLVEVLASIVILTLLLTTFLMMFLSSAKTNKTSEEVVDATYTAQTAMENIYANRAKGRAVALGTYESKGTKEGWDLFEKNADTKELIRVRLKAVEGFDDMEHVIVEVFEMPGKTLRAKMQNVFVWEEELQ